ncbi:ribosome biogenesis factor YjgA [Motiliproteus sediminis]|uniref:ribosome biogenesis factor YjgA n=1 Tax=Motiliproteus sediminis TaxID=1468178 RepID=UPI001AEFFF38|nr:ribosome biogenesis factor YjgA [Motiliproteus sediminis]
MTDLFDDAESGEDQELKSKTQLKREMHDLQELGRKLLAQKSEMLDKLDLNAEMRAAIEEMKRIRSNEARRRHLQYIGKLMRDVDVDQVREVIERQEAGTQAYIRYFHQLESWRDKLIASDDHLEPFMEAYPAAERQHLRQLMRNARKEAERNKPPAAARKLFKYIRELADD